MNAKPVYHITVTAVDGSRVREAPVLKKAIRAALRRHRVTVARLSIALVDDQLIARLNRKYLGHRGPTDVLSFDLRDRQAEKGTVEGELVISVDTAKQEAKRRGHSMGIELALYAVHGVLHLLEYDDVSRRSAMRMHRMEDAILTSAGIRAVGGIKPEPVRSPRIRGKRR